MDLKLGLDQIPEESGNGDGRREGLFVLIRRKEWRNEAKERESQCHPQTSTKETFKFLLSLTMITQKN